jgi:hypothetical protein
MPVWLKVILVVLASALAAAPGFYTYIIRPRLRSPSRRRLERSKTVAIATLQSGQLARITGVVAAREPTLTSPVGRQACIGFRTSIDQKPSNSAGDVWLTVARREACGSFSITDDSGTSTVEGPFRFELDTDDSAWANLPATAYAFLEEQSGPAALKSIGDLPLRFTEALLKPGDRVSLLGRSTSEANDIRGSSEEPVVIVDAEEP